MEVLKWGANIKRHGYPQGRGAWRSILARATGYTVANRCHTSVTLIGLKSGLANSSWHN